LSEQNKEPKEPEVFVETEENQSTNQPGNSETETLKSENEALKKEISDLKDQYLRKAADFDNFRKRIQKEKEESIRYGNQNILADLVNVVDDFERAIKSSESSRDFDNFHQGISMIEQQLVSTLERKYGLKRLESLGTPFNPEHHEAISREEGPEGHALVVVEEFQKGFHLHERVLRTAKVKVGPAQTNESNNNENKIEDVEKNLGEEK